jgi:hypothetical protein
MADAPFQDPGSLKRSVNLDLSYDVVPDIQLPDDVSNLDMEGNPYIGWGQVTKVRRKTGWAIDTLGGNDPEYIGNVVLPCADKLEKIVTGVALRIGEEPAYPQPDPDTDYGKLLDSECAYFNPSVTGSAGRVYGVVWRYRYGYARASALSPTITWGQAPFDKGKAAPVNPNDFLDWLTGK